MQQELFSNRNSISIMFFSSPMKFTGELQSWLPWVIKIRFVIITFVFAIDYAIRVVVPDPRNLASIKYLGIVVVLWYTVSLFFLIYNQISHDYVLQAYLQILSDLVVISAIVHFTGDLESNYFSLYLVVIILGSILLPRGRAFLVAAVSFVFMGALLELAYLPSIYPQLTSHYSALHFLATTSAQSVDLRTLQVKIGASFFGFFAVAYLTSYLAESLRKTGAELRDKTGQVASLQAINENIIQSMGEGLLSTDLDGIITDLNPAGAAILGQRPEILRGQPLAGLLGGLPGADRATVSGTSSSRREITYKTPQNVMRVLGLSSSPLIIPEVGVVGYVYNFQDLTEEKRLEAEYRLKDRMATLGRMAAAIAHEIRNPLASIAGSVKLLQTISQLDEDQSKLIDIVNHESERLNKLVSDFLLYSHDQKFEFQSVDIVNLLEETLLLIEHHPKFSLRIRLERSFPRHAVMVVADPDKLRQVFWNICDNSLKAMPEGGTLTAQIDEAGEKEVRVLLADTGVGFSEAQLEKLFEPFQPGFSDGTGLGLAIVYQIIQGHEGTVRVASNLGKGTRFLIELPKKPGQVPGKKSPAPESARAR